MSPAFLINLDRNEIPLNSAPTKLAMRRVIIVHWQEDT